MELSFIDGVIIGLLVAIITRSLLDWWRSRYVITKRTKAMQDYANKDADLTLKTLYALDKLTDNPCGHQGCYPNNCIWGMKGAEDGRR